MARGVFLVFLAVIVTAIGRFMSSSDLQFMFSIAGAALAGAAGSSFHLAAIGQIK